MRRRAQAEQRFFAKVKSADPLDCWEWTGSRNHLGYGQFWNGSKNVRAHRWAFEFMRAEIIPYNLPLDHECDNPGCVNPWHLDPVDWSENMKRSVSRGRLRPWKPEKHRRGDPPAQYTAFPQYRRWADRVADLVDAGSLKPGDLIRINTSGVQHQRVVELLARWGYAERSPFRVADHPPKPLIHVA